jgi:hypothetical protein
MMAKSKVMGAGYSIDFPKGGSAGKMGGKKSAVQVPGTTSPATKPSGGKFPMGGKGGSVPKGASNPQRPR